MQPDWNDITYLLQGTTLQQKAYDALQNLQVFEILKPYTPVLTGTIPINIPLPGSDLDICCHATNLVGFKNYLNRHFNHLEYFYIKQKEIRNIPCVVCRFTYEGFPIEIFGQNQAVTQQFAYLHMVVEYKILKEKGELFRQQVIALKSEGYKTEPAFAKLLNLVGDPYEALLKLDIKD